MTKYIFLWFIVTLILINFSGCTYLKDKTDQSKRPLEQQRPSSEDETKKKAEPIPVNPQHS